MPAGTTSIHDAYQVPSSPVTPAYFETMGMTLRRGRGFTRSDNANAPRVAVMNESAARRQFGSTDVVGKRFRIPKTPPEEFEVVGVVADAKGGGYGLRERAPADAVHACRPAFRLPEQPGGAERGDPAALAAEIRRVVRETNASLPVLSVRTLHQQVERSLAGDRILAVLATAFGLAALLLVCLGLYGVISQWAAQRTTEIGVRLALGATPALVRRMVLGQALRLLLVGVAIGLPVAVVAVAADEADVVRDPARWNRCPSRWRCCCCWRWRRWRPYLPARRAVAGGPDGGPALGVTTARRC